jgi:hypothetical protein
MIIYDIQPPRSKVAVIKQKKINKQTSKKALAIFTILFLILQIFAVLEFLYPKQAKADSTTYYVANAGNDACDGKSQTIGSSGACAWKTISKVNSSSFLPGDSILFNRGDTWREQLSVPSSGSAGLPIIFGAYGSGAKPIINGANLITTWTLTGTANVWSASSAQAYQLFRNGVRCHNQASLVALVNDYDFYSDGTTIYVYSTTDPSSETWEAGTRAKCISVIDKSYITIENLELKYASSATGGNFDWSALTANPFYGIVLTNIDSSYSWAYGYEFWNTTGGSVDGVTMTGCTDHHSGAVGASFASLHIMGTLGAISNVLIQNSSFSYAGINGGIGTTDVRSHGMSLTSVSGLTVKNTATFGNYGAGIFAERLHSPATEFDYMLVYANSDAGLVLKTTSSQSPTVTFYNGVIYGNGSSGGTYKYGIWSNVSTLTIKNSIIAENYTYEIVIYGGSTLVSNYNDYYHSAGGSFMRWSGANYTFADWKTVSSGDANSISSDPLFVSTVTPDFRLQSTSLAINAGTDVSLTQDYLGTVVPKGAAQDMGAYEYDATAPTLSQTTAVTTPTTDTTPNYVFNSNEAGTISYGGSCSSSATSAAIGDNTITFTALADGTYSDCTITVTDPAGNASSPLGVSNFTIDISAPSSVGAPSFGTITSSSIVVVKPSSVTENGSGLYQWQARRNSTTELGLNATTTTSVTDSSLSENTQYTYDAQFKDNAGNVSSYGTSVSKYTLADTPTNLAGTAGLTTMDLSVDALPNPTAGSSGYYFSRSGANSGWITTNSWSDSGLSCGTSYTYSVIYKNGDGTETTPASLTKSTNSCPGGGGMPPEWNNPPKAPVGGFGVSVNNGAESAAIPTVILNLKGGSDTAKMAISNFSDFRDAGQENYTSSKVWNLCWKNSILQTPLICPAGTYTVYVKFFAPWGTNSGVVSDTIVLKIGTPSTNSPTSPTQAETNPSSPQNQSLTPFTKYLAFLQQGVDVKRLQIFLNQDADTRLANSGPGAPGKETNLFGRLTLKAVIKFQEKYTKDILAPWKLTKGTGFVGKTTLSKINQLLGF